MPAENLSCITELDEVTIAMENKGSKNESCDFSSYNATKSQSITEDENFFKDIQNPNSLDLYPRIQDSADVNDNENWDFSTDQKVDMKHLSIQNDSACKLDSSIDNVFKESNVHQSKGTSHQLKYEFKSKSELQSFSIGTLKKIRENLVSAIEEASSQLVSLLQENDTLQQESDARNIAIEQLLKLTVKQAETEPRPVKMSVILSSSSDSSDEWD